MRGTMKFFTETITGSVTEQLQKPILKYLAL